MSYDPTQKILIVEDSPSQAAIMAELVKEAGYQPELVEDFSRGIAQIVMSVKPLVVLLDLMLLDSKGKQIADGFQACREIKRVAPKVKVVVVSAKDDQESAEWALLQGADAYLQKPFQVEDLLDVIKEMLE